MALRPYGFRKSIGVLLTPGWLWVEKSWWFGGPTSVLFKAAEGIIRSLVKSRSALCLTA